MWGRMKKRLYDFFFYETIETIELIDKEKKKQPHVPIHRNVDKKKQQQQHSPIHRNVETKITYKYPETKEFKFPLIPDIEHRQQRNRNDQSLEIPTYMRKERLNDNNQTETYEEQQREKPKRFIPTDVPSPIYGYQRRKKEKAIQNTPAYIRRQMRKEQATSREEIAATVDIVEEDEQVKQVEHNVSPTHDERINHHTHTMKTDEDVVKKPMKEKQSQEIEKRRPERSDTRKNIQKHDRKERATQASGDIPFNVMMTRQDKIRYERQQMKQVERSKTLANEVTSKQAKKEEQTKVEQPMENAYEIPIHLLDDPVPSDSTDQVWLQEQQHLLEETFRHFNVDATVVHVTQGPSVTRFEVQPALGVKVSKVRNLSDDIKLNLSAKDIRIEAPIPGRNTIGIEIPNLHAQTVSLYEILYGDAFMQSNASLPIGLGVTIEGEPLITDIAKMPHGLIAGATGSGKSVCINTILLSLLYHAHYDDVKLLLIDPKMVELTPYNGIPHLVSPVITNVKAANAALQWAVNEMEKRYEQFVEAGVRDIHRFNEKVKQEGRTADKMPFIVIVIDELADLMMAAPQDVEDSISRIAQKARACGMHLLIATQRPSVDVITGLIKANIPTRIAFSVSSQVDSRTIIDTNGAERLLGKGDMLFMDASGRSIRLQGAFVSDDEIDRVVQNVKQMAPPQYLFEEEELVEITSEMDDDPLLEEVITFISTQNSVSTSMLQRQFRVGYNRAARLMETLEQREMISGQNGSKPRDILI